MKLHLHAPVLVGEDLLSGRTRHHGSLRSLNHRLGCRRSRPERQSIGEARKAVLVTELLKVSGSIIARQPRRVLRSGHKILAVRVEVTFQSEFVTRHDLPAVARHMDLHAPGGFYGLHAEPDSPPIVLKNLLELGGLLASAAVDPVKALGIGPRIIIDLEALVAANLQFVRHLARSHTVQNRFLGFKVLVRELERVVPERILARSQFLGLLPTGDSRLLPQPTRYFLVDKPGLHRQAGVALRRIGHDHFVAVRRVLEKVVDPFFFHQAAGEIKIGFTILNAVVSRVKHTLDFEAHIQPLEHLLQYVRD